MEVGKKEDAAAAGEEHAQLRSQPVVAHEYDVFPVSLVRTQDHVAIGSDVEIVAPRSADDGGMGGAPGDGMHHAKITAAVSRRAGRMRSTTERKRAVRREERVSRTYRLPLSKLKAAQRALGAATATEAIERALDLAVFQRELVDGTRAMLGVEITSPDLEP